MNLARSTALLLLATWASAQDVEPTSARAIRSLVHELVSELPYRVPNGEALAIEAAPSSDKNVVGAFTAALVDSGFRVQSASIQSGAAVPVRVSTRKASGFGGIRVEAGDFASERLFGNASWVDSPPRDSTIVAMGPPKTSRDEALNAARDKVRAQLRSRFPGLAGNSDFERYLSRPPTASFVSVHTVDGRPVYEAWALAEPDFDVIARAERAAMRSERRAPWIRSGLLGGAAVFFYLLYVRADFRTRGWRTRRLRILFGTLFVALSVGLWSLPL